MPFFKVWVRTERTYLGAEPDQYPVLPGMQTTVDLLIGRRTRGSTRAFLAASGCTRRS